MNLRYRLLIPSLALSLVFFSGVQMFGQTFSLKPTTTSASGAPGQPLETFAEVTNLTSNALQLRVVKNIIVMPEGWSVSFCLANCFSPEATDVVDELSPNQVVSLHLTFETSAAPGDADVEMILSSVANPAENTSITFHVTTGTASAGGQNALPRIVTVSQNYPNPLSISSGTASNINFTLPRAGHVSIRIYNLLGQEVRSLVNEVRAAGNHSVTWDARDRNSATVLPGIYMYKVSTEGVNITRRMLVTR